MTNEKAHGSPGILMVMMDPPETELQEFHDWYDAEHVPERAAIQGFRSLQRYVCLEGWPRYMALYDLDSLQVLRSEPYRAVAGDNFSPWSKRVIAKVTGWTRTEAELVEPGPPRTGANGLPLRLIVLRFRDVPERDSGSLRAAMDAFIGDEPGVLQTRLFRSRIGTEDQFYALIETSAPWSLSALAWNRLRLPSGAVDIANVYTRYWRKEA